MTIHDFHQDADGRWQPTAEGRADRIGKRWKCRECEGRRAA